MNAIFTVIFLICTLLLLCTSPDLFLGALLDGAGKGAGICISLVATYSVWMGLMKVWEDSGLARGVSRMLKPLARRILKTDNDEAVGSACMSFSVNMLGISGAATPYGVKTAQLLDKTDNAEYSSAMFFVLNATSLQILPSSLVAVRLAMGSSAPNDIILPTLIVSAFSTILAALLTRLLIKPKSIRKTSRRPNLILGKNIKMTGAGTR
jgi:spore maturation protein A